MLGSEETDGLIDTDGTKEVLGKGVEVGRLDSDGLVDTDGYTEVLGKDVAVG